MCQMKEGWPVTRTQGWSSKLRCPNWCLGNGAYGTRYFPTLLNYYCFTVSHLCLSALFIRKDLKIMNTFWKFNISIENPRILDKCHPFNDHLYKMCLAMFDRGNTITPYTVRPLKIEAVTQHQQPTNSH